MSMKAFFMRNLSGAALALAALLSPLAAHAAAEPAPRLGDVTPMPVAAPYPSSDVAHEQVAAAFETAKRTGRKVLIDFGGNWCPDCRIMAGIFELPAARRWLDSQFVTVAVNVGRENVNLDLAEKYGVKITAVPTVIIVTPDGKALNTDGSRALGDARHMSSQAVLDLIAEWNARG